MPDDRVGTTVAVVVRNRCRQMTACLDGIAAQVPPADEIVVVDNGSTDGTWELLEARAGEWPRLKVARDSGSLGHIRNLAVALATSDIVAFTDSDCVPDAAWLAAISVPFRDSHIAAVQGRTVAAASVERRWAATQSIDGFSHLFEACNIAYRRGALLSAGGFGEDIGFFGEDTIAGWSLLRAGWHATFAPDAVVRHDVTYPGPWWHLRRGLRYSNWSALVKQFPEMRGAILWHRVFLNRCSAEWDLAVIGVVAAVLARRVWPTLAVVPYLAEHRGRRAGVTGVMDSLAGVAFDAARGIGLAAGTVRHRTMVL